MAKFSVSFTASKDDFKLYLACPRKLALKTLGFRVRESKRASGLSLSYAIGVSGERLTEEVLEIIASLQADHSKGEHVEFYGERSEGAKRAEKAIVEALRKSAKTVFEDEELREVEPIAEPIIESTIEKSFEDVKSPPTVEPYEDLVESYKESYKEEMKRGFLGLLKDMTNKIPKILAVYKPVLRNRDTCSLGYPDYQVETEEGHILVEVKNLAELSKALKEARDHRASRKQLIVEVLNKVVIPLLNKIENYESKCEKRVGTPGSLSISTSSIDVKFHAESETLYKRFIELFKGHHDYKGFQRGIDEFNCVQSALEKKVNTLESTLANILQGDKHIQALWEEKVKKREEYSRLDFTKAKDTIIIDFISSWCHNRPVGVWYVLGEDLWREYCDKVKDVLSEVDELIERRKQIAQKLKEMLKKVLDKAVEDYNILDSELGKGKFELV
jgi:hypothetical protein